jgi:hypothetical protein
MAYANRHEATPSCDIPCRFLQYVTTVASLYVNGIEAPPPIIPTTPAPTIIPPSPLAYSTTPAPAHFLRLVQATPNVDRQSASQYAPSAYAQ